MDKQVKRHTVKLREKELANGDMSLYLDMWVNGKRKKEYLKLHVINSTKPIDKKHNKDTRALAEDIRAKRQVEIQNMTYGFIDDFKLDTNFIAYFKSLIDKRKNSKGNHGNWDSTLKHLLRFCDPNTSFRDIDTNFVEGFKYHLQHNARTKSDTPLSQNSQCSYFNKFKASINAAFDERIILDNPAKRVKGIKQEETHREYLTLDELKRLVKAETKYPIMKKAFLFSCLTGIRWSDINKLTWSEVVQHNEGHRIVFRQKKTKGFEYLDISSQALKLLGDRENLDDRVFKGLKYSGWHNTELQKWIMRAGLTVSH